MSRYKYIQLAENLKSKILKGHYAPGERIPTEPELSKMFSASRYTVRQAVSLLENEGLLQRIQGSGTYVQKTSLYSSEYEKHDLKSNTIALVMMDDHSYIFSDIMYGASNYLTSKGYLLNVFLTDGNYDSEKQALDMLLSSPPAGILLEPTNSGLLSVNYSLYQQLSEKLPCLLLHSPDIGTCPSLSLRDREGAQMLTDHLIRLGHKKIGTIFCVEEFTSQNRYCGFLESLRRHGLVQDENSSIWTLRKQIGNLFESSGSPALEQMLQSVTAVFCHDDRIAYKLIRFLEQKGLCVPEDISVAGYDDSFFATLDQPITSVTHPKSDYGIQAAQALLKMIHSTEPIELLQFTAKPKLVIRESTASPPQRT